MIDNDDKHETRSRGYRTIEIDLLQTVKSKAPSQTWSLEQPKAVCDPTCLGT